MNLDHITIENAKDYGITFTIETMPEAYYLAVEERDNMIDKDSPWDQIILANNWLARVRQSTPGDWTWCNVKVTARHNDLELECSDYLGCCSYEDEQQFKDDGYYADMCNQALEELKAEIAHKLTQYQKLYTLYNIDPNLNYFNPFDI